MVHPQNVYKHLNDLHVQPRIQLLVRVHRKCEFGILESVRAPYSVLLRHHISHGAAPTQCVASKMVKHSMSSWKQDIFQTGNMTLYSKLCFKACNVTLQSSFLGLLYLQYLFVIYFHTHTLASQDGRHLVGLIE